DRSFKSCRDADDRIGPILELFHGGSYVWLPVEQITHLQISEPKSARDLLWARAKGETYEQSGGDVFLPTPDVHSYTNANQAVRLGRVTEWQLIGDQLVWGTGQRVLLLDDQEVSFLELRDLRLQPSAAGAS